MPILFVKDNIHHFKKMNYCLLPAAVGQLHRLPSHAHFATCYSTSPIPMGRLPSSVYHYHQHIYHGHIFYQKMLHRTDLIAHPNNHL